MMNVNLHFYLIGPSPVTSAGATRSNGQSVPDQLAIVIKGCLGSTPDWTSSVARSALFLACAIQFVNLGSVQPYQ